MDLMLYNLTIRATYDMGKYILKKGLNDANIKDFSKIFNDTLNQVSMKYGTSRSDLEAFFNSQEIHEYMEQHLEDMKLDFEYMGNILINNYIYLDSQHSPNEVLAEFFNTLQTKLLENPSLKNKLITKYFRVLNSNALEAIKNTELIMEKQEYFEEILSKVTISGKTLMRENYPNNYEFFKEIGKILEEDPLYIHKLNIEGSKINYSLIPRSADAQKLEPIRTLFTITLEQKDGKIITIEDMIKEAEKDGKPIIFDAEAIKEVFIYKGQKSLLPEGQKIHRIELRPIPYELPVKIFVPNCDIEYDIVLRVTERMPQSLVVSNFFSDFPIKFKFQFDIENEFRKSGNFEIKCDIYNMDVSQAYKFNKFFREAIEQGIMGLRGSESGKIIFIAHIKDKTVNIASENEFLLLKKLSFIQEIIGKRIPLPLNMTAEDVSSIQDVYAFYKDKKVLRSSKGHVLRMKQNSISAKIMLEKANKEGIFENICIREKDAKITICNNELPLGSIEMQFPPMKTEKTVEELREELAKLTEESIEIVMLPIDDRPLIITPEEWIDKEV